MERTIEGVWDPEKYANDVGAAKVPEYFNPGSPKQVKWLLYHPHAFRLRVPKGFEVNTAEPTLEALEKHPFIDALLEYRGLLKQKSTYVESNLERVQRYPDRRLHSTYLIHGTVTGRLSSRDPNNQNWPRVAKIRDAVQAPPGRMLFEADYSQAELRGLALLSQDEFLMEVYRTGRDLHDEVAKDFFPGWEFEPDEFLKKEQRIRAKFVNFGIAYGRGEESIAKEFGISRQEARQYIERWFKRAHRAAAFLRHCRQTAASGGTLVTPFGRKRRFGLVTPENRHVVMNEASNFPIQSTASDLTIISAIRMDPYLEEYGAYVVNLVHDSILVEGPDDPELTPIICDIILRTMIETPTLTLGSNVPFEADVKVGYKWGSLKPLEANVLV
jgi:DNA polymerase-1